MSQIPRRKPGSSTVAGHSNGHRNADDAQSMLSVQSTPATNDGARRRQSKRDEAIRKKFESELMKKSRSRSRRDQPAAAIPHHMRVPGTVGALRPTQALTVREAMSVVEASQLMAAKRADCVLVVDSNEHLAGIFTAKDLAFRVVADDLDARNTLVRDIMTPNPFCVTADTPATDALNTMVRRHFRHLPVCNDEGDVVGLLDITRCMYEALDKMERAYGSSRKLYEAVEGVEREWSANQPAALMQFVEALREKMSCPDLTSILDNQTDVAGLGVRSTVRDAAQLMKTYGTTAVLIMEGDTISGIFTSKDIVLRVIAAGLSPSTCSVVRVMTPHPDTAPPNITLLQALRKMHDGHYLNLPVVDEGEVLGIVDVLKLTYHALEQINSIEGSNDSENPVWSRFFSFGADDSMSEISESQMTSSAFHANDSHLAHHNQRLSSEMMNGHDSGIISTANHARGPSRASGHHSDEIYPNESASAAGIGDKNVPTSEFQRYPDNCFAFKFKDPRNGRTHRYVAALDNLPVLRSVVADKLGLGGSNVDGVRADGVGLCYVDDEGDQVLVATEDDLVDAVSMARRQGLDRVVLIISGIEGDYSEAHQGRLRAKDSRRTSASSSASYGTRRTAASVVPSAQASGLSRDVSGSNSGKAPGGGPLDGIRPEYLQAAVIGLSVALIGILVAVKLR
ncbi:hypothetical protein BDF19DRAFT_454359 [Syncephalis fuscata]|nr:hypothetical protein BDF19DRAFT_454359 [Syncephalis fuscata]